MRKVGGLAVGFVFCVFMGITAVSMGLGAAYPPINRVAGPLVCPDGEMEFEQRTRNPLPGRTYLSAHATCVDSRTGAREELGQFPMSLYSGLCYGTGMFVLLAIPILLRRSGSSGPPPHRA